MKQTYRPVQSRGQRKKLQYTFQAQELEKMLPRKTIVCPNCSTWEAKTHDLICGYEQLAEAKQREIEAVNKMIINLEDQIISLHRKNEIMSKRLEGSQIQFENLQKQHQQCQEVIRYYKDREVELLSQLKAAENELFTKTVQIKDDKDDKEQKTIEKLNKTTKNTISRSLLKTQTEPKLIPIIKESETLGKLLQKSLADIEKMGRQKLLTEVKHRMAMLKAVELSVLK